MHNILLRTTISEMNNAAIEKFFRSNRSLNNVIVYNIVDDSALNVNIAPQNMYETSNMINHEYRKYPDYMKAKPIDEKLMRSMAPYESMAYKMMDLYFPGVSEYSCRRKILLEAIRLLNHIIETNSIDLFISIGAPHQVYDYILYSLCKIKGISTFIVYRMPIRGYLFFYNDICDQGKYFTKVHDVKREDISKPFLDMYKKYSESDSYIKPYYMKLSKVDRIKRFGEQIQTFKKYASKPKVVFEIMRLLKEKRAKDSFIKKNSKDKIIDKKYIYMALHYQPEATTVPLGGIFADQYLIVEMLSHCVPDDIYVCVKEHPSQGIRGGKNRKFFESISNLRNVILAPTFYDSGILLEKSIAIATCTGTIAFEAMFKSKPALLFGDYIYNDLPNAIHVKTYADCCDAMKAIEKGMILNEQEKLDYIGTLDTFKYHAEYIIEEKEYMLSNGLDPRDNNENLYKMLMDMVAYAED